MIALGHFCGGQEERGVGILPHPGSRGGSFNPPNGHILLRPMLRQDEGCQGEANSVYVETRVVLLSPVWTRV